MVAKIAVIYYSTYGHVRTLAEAIAEEARTHGAEVDLLQIPEILSDEIRGKMHAAPRADHPEIKPQDLTKYDGFLLGMPTRYGRAPAAVSAFFDATGGLWASGALVGKFAGIFTSSASQHGGQESTALTTLPFLAHHGVIYVPIGFAAPELSDNSEIVGGSAYGAAGVAGGDGSRQISAKELNVARYQAKFFTTTVATFVAGKTALAKHAVAPKESMTTAPTVSEGEPVLAKAVPAQTEPYHVDETAAAAPAEAVKEPSPVAAEPTLAPAPAAESTPAAAPAPKSETAPAPAPAAAAAPAPKTEAAKPKKKAGLFASCCGGSAKNYD